MSGEQRARDNFARIKSHVIAVCSSLDGPFHRVAHWNGRWRDIAHGSVEKAFRLSKLRDMPLAFLRGFASIRMPDFVRKRVPTVEQLSERILGILREHAPAAVVLLVGVVVSLAAFMIVRHYNQVADRHEFDRKAAHYLLVSHKAVGRYVETISDAGVLVAEFSGQLGRWEFFKFAEEAWPANTRAEVSFTVGVFWTRAGTAGPTVKTSEAWRCSRKAGRRVTVATGIFETIPIVCERSGGPQGAWHKRIWYYAPSVRHFVRRESISGEERRMVDLVAIKLGARDWPPAARGGLEQAIQATLGGLPIGAEAKWGSTAIGAKFAVKPTSEVDRPDGANCRTYVLIRSDSDSPRVYPAVACRNEESGAWLVPVLDRDKGAVRKLLFN